MAWQEHAEKQQTALPVKTLGPRQDRHSGPCARWRARHIWMKESACALSFTRGTAPPTPPLQQETLGVQRSFLLLSF